MKNREAAALYEFLIMMQTKEVSLSIAEWKTLADNKDVLAEHLQKINETRNEIVRKYSSDNKDNKAASVDEDKKDEFTKEYLDMLEDSVDLKLETIGIENLGETMSGKNGIWEFMKFMVTK